MLVPQAIRFLKQKGKQFDGLLKDFKKSYKGVTENKRDYTWDEMADVLDGVVVE